MKKIIALILIFLLLFTSTASAEIYYSDTYNHWSRSDINIATNVLKVFNGYSDMTFRPDNSITRSEFITILVRTGIRLGIMSESYTSSMNYTDMTINNWSYTYIITFYEYMKQNFTEYKFEDIFTGKKFEPNKPITRNESIALIGVLCKKSVFDNAPPFTDVSNTHKFYNQIKNLYNLGILEGYDDNTLQLTKKITRGESATLIRKVYENIKITSVDYFSELKYMPIENEDVLSFFGTYNLKTQDSMEQKYIKAKNTLEYLAFGGYIFDEDKHLYDTNAIGTLKSLRSAGFPNVAGVNFFLLKYGNLTNSEKVIYANEILRNVLNRNDLTDSDLIQIFKLIKKYNVTEALYIDALRKWYDSTNNLNVKFNIKTLVYEHYIKVENKTFVKAMMYEDLKSGTDFNKILTINWDVKTGVDYDFLQFNSLKMYYTPFAMSSFNIDEYINSSKNVAILRKIALVENDLLVDTSSIKSENLYYKYSLNKGYILRYIGEFDRGFAEMLNDWKIVKNFSIYKTGKSSIDEYYKGMLINFK